MSSRCSPTSTPLPLIESLESYPSEFKLRSNKLVYRKGTFTPKFLTPAMMKLARLSLPSQPTNVPCSTRHQIASLLKILIRNSQKISRKSISYMRVSEIFFRRRLSCSSRRCRRSTTCSNNLSPKSSAWTPPASSPTSNNKSRSSKEFPTSWAA